MHRVRKISELERKQIRVGQTHHGRAAGLGKRAAVDKIGIAEMCVPIEIVVDGVIDAAVVFAAETDVERGDAVVLQERGVIRTGTERGNS